MRVGRIAHRAVSLALVINNVKDLGRGVLMPAPLATPAAADPLIIAPQPEPTMNGSFRFVSSCIRVDEFVAPSLTILLYSCVGVGGRVREATRFWSYLPISRT